MDEDLRAQIDAHLPALESLIARGRQLHEDLLQDPDSRPTQAAARAWQQECASAVNQLSGGSKAHWLSRAFSRAFLLGDEPGHVVEASPAAIAERLVGVLEQGVRSLSEMGERGAGVPPPPAPRRFDFVHDPALRPVVEEAYSDCRRDLDEGRNEEALRTACGILEAIVTDALEHRGVLALSEKPSGKVSEWSFEARLFAAERLGLIRGGWSRLSETARRYREIPPGGPPSREDAERARQVLHVAMKDLDPGR
jgi:plasmid stabilization system protein ParE